MSSFEMFDYYFLGMMLFACFMLYFFESKGFKQQGDDKGCIVGEKTSIIMGIISIALFVLARFV